MPPSLGSDSLIHTVRDLIEELDTVGLFKTELSENNFNESILDDQRRVMLYRIIQEQINNIIKYSKAKNVLVGLKLLDNQFLLTISDNGVGFDVSKKARGIGLQNIESRASFYGGSMRIQSTPGEGTMLEVLLPV